MADNQEEELERRLEEARARVADANRRPLQISVADLGKLREAAHEAWTQLEEYRRTVQKRRSPAAQPPEPLGAGPDPAAQPVGRTDGTAEAADRVTADHYRAARRMALYEQPSQPSRLLAAGGDSPPIVPPSDGDTAGASSPDPGASFAGDSSFIAETTIVSGRGLLLPGDEVPPDVPEPGPGSIFVATAAGFELDPRLPEETERNDAVQNALHISITRRIERLRDAIARISNTHPILAAEFADYAVFVGPDLAELDVASLWSAGSGLSEFVRAFDTQDPSSTITPPLEPETLAEFRALLRDHTAFILGFDTGRKLTERAAALHAVERRPEEIKDAALAVLRPMLNTPRLLAGRAQHLVQSLTRALEDWPAKTFSLLVGSVETGKNSLIAFGRAFEPIILSFAGADLALTLAGVKHADTLRAAALFLHDNCDAVTAFIASDPQLTEWLLWLIERSRRLVTPLSTKNNLDLPRTQESPTVVGSPAFAQTGSEDNRVFPVRHSLGEISGLIQAGLVRGDPPQRVAETVTHLISQGDINLELRFNPAPDTDTLIFDLFRDKRPARTFSFPK